MHPVYNARRRCHKIQIVLAFQAFLDNIQMEKPQETTPETKAQRYRCLWLKIERCIVELQFFQRVPQIRIFRTIRRIKTAVYHRRYLLVTRKRLCTWVVQIGNRIAHAGILHIFNTGSHIANHTG